MDGKIEWKKLALGVAVFAAFFWMPANNPHFIDALREALALTRWYAREHVLLCLVPAFFIAGAIAVFVSKASVMKYLGPKVPPVLAYGVASVSGTILAVCSCTVLPLFAGIWRMGAGLGPATAFLYAGPAINVLAIILTARVLGAELGIARAVGAVGFSIVIGVSMHLIYRHEHQEQAAADMAMPDDASERTGRQNVIYFALMVAILVFANWGGGGAGAGFAHFVWAWKWVITSVLSLGLAVVLGAWFGVAWWRLAVVTGATLLAYGLTVFWLGTPDHGGGGLAYHAMIPFAVAIVGLSWVLTTREGAPHEWFGQSWFLAKQMMPLLLAGVFVAGMLLGHGEAEGLIPKSWVVRCVGGNSLSANLSASLFGAFMYFATLTEVPILSELMSAGMGKGPALSLLLAGPALSLPNMLVIRSVIGTRKTIVFVCLVVITSATGGMLFGTIWG